MPAGRSRALQTRETLLAAKTRDLNFQLSSLQTNLTYLTNATLQQAETIPMHRQRLQSLIQQLGPLHHDALNMQHTLTSEDFQRNLSLIEQKMRTSLNDINGLNNDIQELSLKSTQIDAFSGELGGLEPLFINGVNRGDRILNFSSNFFSTSSEFFDPLIETQPTITVSGLYFFKITCTTENTPAPVIVAEHMGVDNAYTTLCSCFLRNTSLKSSTCMTIRNFQIGDQIEVKNLSPPDGNLPTQGTSVSLFLIAPN